MTAVTTDSSEKVLQKILFEEQLPVTYRLFCRELNIDPAKSHSLLEEFYQKHKTELDAFYILTYITGEGVRKYEVVKSDDPKIEQVSGSKEFSSSIYSISRTKNLKIEEIISGVESTIFEKYSAIKNKESSLKNHQKWGILTNYVPLVIKTPSIQASNNNIDNAKTRIASNRSKSVGYPTDSKKIAGSGKKQLETSSVLSRYVSRKSEKDKKSKSKNSIMSNIKRANTDPTSSVADALHKNKKHCTETTVDSKTVPDQIVKDSTFKKPIKSEADVKKEELQRKELEKMFDDDSWGEDDSDMKIDDNDAIDEKQPEIQEPLSVRSEDTKSVISMKSEISQSDLPNTVSIEEVEPEPSLECYIDSDGFMVTNKKENHNNKKSKATETKKPPVSNSTKTVSENSKVNKNKNGKKVMKQSTLLKFLK